MESVGPWAVDHGALVKALRPLNLSNCGPRSNCQVLCFRLMTRIHDSFVMSQNLWVIIFQIYIFSNSNSDLFILDSVRSVITDSFASWFSTTGQNDGIIGNQSSPDDVMQRTNQNWMTTEANIEYNSNENSNSPFEKTTYRIVWVINLWVTHIMTHNQLLMTIEKHQWLTATKI